MVDTTKESTCYPVNSNDEIVLTDGEVYIVSDNNASVKVGGFFIKYTLQPRDAT